MLFIRNTPKTKKKLTIKAGKAYKGGCKGKKRSVAMCRANKPNLKDRSFDGLRQIFDIMNRSKWVIKP